MYVIVYDTLMKIFENISRKKVSWNNLYLRERRKSLYVRYLWNLKTRKNGETISPFTLYREQKRSGIYPALNLEEKCYPLDQDFIVGCQGHSAA